MAIRQPSPASPTRADTGSRTSSKNSSANSMAPVICRKGRTVRPGASMGTMKHDMARCVGASGSVRTKRRHQSAHFASVVHTFWPFTT